MIGNYRYTTDLIDDFEDISTGLHRQNSKLGMARAFLTQALDMDEMVELYHKITSEVYYDVQDYEAGLGVTTERNNDIRYFAVDNRLYPLGGRFMQTTTTTGARQQESSMPLLDSPVWIWMITYPRFIKHRGS